MRILLISALLQRFQKSASAAQKITDGVVIQEDPHGDVVFYVIKNSAVDMKQSAKLAEKIAEDLRFWLGMEGFALSTIKNAYTASPVTSLHGDESLQKSPSRASSFAEIAVCAAAAFATGKNLKFTYMKPDEPKSPAREREGPVIESGFTG